LETNSTLPSPGDPTPSEIANIFNVGVIFSAL
jgi:hypothetical protein